MCEQYTESLIVNVLRLCAELGVMRKADAYQSYVYQNAFVNWIIRACYACSSHDMRAQYA